MIKLWERNRLVDAKFLLADLSLYLNGSCPEGTADRILPTDRRLKNLLDKAKEKAVP